MDDALLNNPPRGFTVERDGDTIRIHFKRVPILLLNILLSALLIGWTVGLVQLPSVGEEWWFNLAFFLAELVLIYVVAWVLFVRATFTFTADELFIETCLGPFKTRRRVKRSDVEHLRQSEDDDSVPKLPPHLYSLNLYATDRMRTLFASQPHETSLWLGRVISQWANVWFGECKSGG